MAYNEMRENTRDLVENNVAVNNGSPFHGGMLHDISHSGAAVMYPKEAVSIGEPVEIGQILNLRFQGRGNLPGRVSRLFEGGFATKFDFSIPVVHL